MILKDHLDVSEIELNESNSRGGCLDNENPMDGNGKEKSSFSCLISNVDMRIFFFFEF